MTNNRVRRRRKEEHEWDEKPERKELYNGSNSTITNSSSRSTMAKRRSGWTKQNIKGTDGSNNDADAEDSTPSLSLLVSCRRRHTTLSLSYLVVVVVLLLFIML